MQQREDDDWFMRQIKGFAQSLHYFLTKSSGEPPVEIVWPKEAPHALPHQAELRTLLAEQDFGGAMQHFAAVRYSMAAAQYLELGAWFYQALSGFSDAQLAGGGASKAEIQAGLQALQQMAKDS